MMTVNEYLDLIMQRNTLKNDAALARSLHLQPPYISKLRHARMPFSLMIMMRLHECLGCSVAEMRQLIHADEFSVEARAANVVRKLAPAEALL